MNRIISHEDALPSRSFFTTKQKTLPTRLSKLNKSTCVCYSNLSGQYFKDYLERNKLAGK